VEAEEGPVVAQLDEVESSVVVVSRGPRHMPGPIWDTLASEARGAVHLSELVVIFVYHFGFNIDLSKRSLCASFFLFLIHIAHFKTIRFFSAIFSFF
jgi:hypothetical protein